MEEKIFDDYTTEIFDLTTKVTISSDDSSLGGKLFFILKGFFYRNGIEIIDDKRSTRNTEVIVYGKLSIDDIFEIFPVVTGVYGVEIKMDIIDGDRLCWRRAYYNEDRHLFFRRVAY